MGHDFALYRVATRRVYTLMGLWQCCDERIDDAKMGYQAAVPCIYEVPMYMSLLFVSSC